MSERLIDRSRAERTAKFDLELSLVGSIRQDIAVLIQKILSGNSVITKNEETERKNHFEPSTLE